jgi:hypothetical protein
MEEGRQKTIDVRRQPDDKKISIILLTHKQELNRMHHTLPFTRNEPIREMSLHRRMQ